MAKLIVALHRFANAPQNLPFWLLGTPRRTGQKESNDWGIFKEWKKQDQLGSYEIVNIWELDQ